MLEGVQNVAEAGLDDFGGVSDGHGNFDGKPCQGVGDAFGLGRPDPSAITAIRIHRWADIPTI